MAENRLRVAGLHPKHLIGRRQGTELASEHGERHVPPGPANLHTRRGDREAEVGTAARGQ
jgi:hypothetical protein